jgi:hypothetical protein
LRQLFNRGDFLKTKFFVVVLFFSYCSSFAQLAINSESADFENNKLSPKNYFGQELEVVAFSFTKAWFTSAVPKKLWNFEIFLIGNASVVSENKIIFNYIE